MTENLLLLPHPRQLSFDGEGFNLPEKGLIAIDAPHNQELFFSARLLQRTLAETCSLQWEIIAGSAVPDDQLCLALMVTSGSIGHAQGYSLTISPQRINIIAEQASGIFYAAQTLRQIIRQSGIRLPCLRCLDWPDFPNRGVMLDISRDKVPSMPTLYALVDLLAAWKLNQVQLYTEHTFAYRQHPEVWADASPMTGEQILELDAYCRQRFIELVPNQNTFGHMRPWLVHEKYRRLAEAPDGCDTRWGHFDQPFSLNPGEPGSLELVSSLLDELLPNFSSRQVNVGCDETVDLGQGASQERVQALGLGRVYFEFLMKIYRQVKARGRTMQFWGDIIVEHPELAPELPRDTIVLEWGYEADHPFDEHAANFAASGIPFYVCPGTSSWNSVAGRSDNALANLRNAAQNGLKHSAVGYLITDWGDNGHWQPLPVSYLGFTYGAALAWGVDANQEVDVTAILNQHAFCDQGGVIGSLAYALGNVHLETGLVYPNASALFGCLQASVEEVRQKLPEDTPPQAIAQAFRQTLRRIDAIMQPLAQTDMQRPDAGLVQDEFAWAADMLRHACRRMLWILGEPDATAASLSVEAGRLIDQHRQLWQARNRPGGMSDSLARLEKMRRDYQLPDSPGL